MHLVHPTEREYSKAGHPKTKLIHDQYYFNLLLFSIFFLPLKRAFRISHKENIGAVSLHPIVKRQRPYYHRLCPKSQLGDFF